jgi:hypothetical protein
MNQKLSKNSPEKENSKSVWDNGLVLFFFAPIVFLFLTSFTGNQIFYGKAGNQKKNSKQVLLLSAGSLFYLIVLIIALS